MELSAIIGRRSSRGELEAVITANSRGKIDMGLYYTGAQTPFDESEEARQGAPSHSDLFRLPFPPRVLGRF